MKVKIVVPENAPGLRDPHTKRQPFIDAERRPIAEAVDVPDSNFWRRRIRDGEIALADAAPVVNAPIAPLTTR